MNAQDVAGLAALTVIAIPLLIAMGASMKPERRPRRPPRSGRLESQRVDGTRRPVRRPR